ncbi:MAG: class I tRNA ligase family protein, partial [Candidatus Diapherotrites archaeon]|nr:class I tRNA ligase family protein [Candidatus Diapherotrites archaeon]
MVEFNEIELKWQKEWAKADLGTAKREEGKKKFFLIFAYPGPSGYMHVGHMRGYSFSDAICRYKRMRGFNVFFPVGLHASGLPAVGVAKRVERGDEKWIKYLKDNGTSDADIKKMKDPNFVVEYFGKDYVERWKRFGFLSDWGSFTSSNWEDYGKFIQWQFLQLMEKKLLTQAPSFAPACVDCGPVAIDPSETDLRQGGTATQNEYTLLKFKFDLNGDKAFIIAATLRPETVYGQTNLWVNPAVEYVRAKVDGETWIISSQCAKKLSYQGKEVEIEGKVPAKSLIGKFCTAPGIDREVPILPAAFVSPDVGSGLVTSVPSDAPYDYIALKELQDNPEAVKGVDPKVITSIELIPIIKTEGYSDFPAKDAVERFRITSQTEVESLEEATQEIYKAGFHKGVMMSIAGDYAGMQVSQAKDNVKKWLTESGNASSMYDLSEEVICRCGGTVVVKLIPNQWFINYADDEWTSKSRSWVKSMFIRPKDYADALPDVMSWFQARPCARQGRWIGTAFPFERNWIIEPIADSTLYPTY